MTTIKFYSVAGKKNVEVDIAKVELVVMKNGRSAAQAVDPDTGVKLFKILGAADKALITAYQAKNPPR